MVLYDDADVGWIQELLSERKLMNKVDVIMLVVLEVMLGTAAVMLGMLLGFVGGMKLALFTEWMLGYEVWKFPFLLAGGMIAVCAVMKIWHKDI